MQCCWIDFRPLVDATGCGCWLVLALLLAAAVIVVVIVVLLLLLVMVVVVLPLEWILVGCCLPVMFSPFHIFPFTSWDVVKNCRCWLCWYCRCYHEWHSDRQHISTYLTIFQHPFWILSWLLEFGCWNMLKWPWQRPRRPRRPRSNMVDGKTSTAWDPRPWRCNAINKADTQ